MAAFPVFRADGNPATAPVCAGVCTGEAVVEDATETDGPLAVVAGGIAGRTEVAVVRAGKLPGPVVALVVIGAEVAGVCMTERAIAVFSAGVNGGSPVLIRLLAGLGNAPGTLAGTAA